MRYLLLAPLLLLMSCSMFKPGARKASTDKTPPVASLSGTSWQLDSIIGFKPEKELVKPVTLNFSDTSNEVYGFGGCNGYGGRYAQSRDELRFSRLLSTKMYCAVGSRTETRVTFVLLNCDHAAMDHDGRLLLMKGENTLAVFKKYGPRSE
ncbi:MAG TPA: META domain-containing protein [Edaphocola sp.]|nr:META domain-containing protein [Edaphocola sp.]